jgi:phage tail sheath gpL-like
MIENLITTYQKNSYGDEDDSYLQVETLFSLMFVTRYLRTAVTSKFGRMKLAADGTRFAGGGDCDAKHHQSRSDRGIPDAGL